MVGMRSYEWLKPFVGGVPLMAGAWLLQLGFEVADGAIRRSRISGLELDEIVSLFGPALRGGGTALFLVGGGTRCARPFGADSNPGRAGGRGR